VERFSLEEGDDVEVGQPIAVISTDQLQARKQQQIHQLDELDGSLASSTAQLELQRSTLYKMRNVAAAGGVSSQNTEELATQLKVSEAQRTVLLSKKEQVNDALNIIELQIKDATISSPIRGTILNKYFQTGELVNPGMLVAELADLSKFEAKIYLPLDKLNQVKIGQEVSIRIDGSSKTFPGKISWIASESEFTPKTILTKETRTTLVYAVKVLVENKEGILKIGMPIEVTI
jgi:HlyD family secretion protein